MSAKPKVIPVKFHKATNITPAIQSVRDTQDRLWGKDWRKKQLVAAHAISETLIIHHYR